MIKVMSIVGTRPEAIKMAPLLRLLAQAEQVESVLCLTAQHREMLDQVLALFALHPQYDLDIMQPEQSLTHITARALEGLEKVMCREQPHLVLVQGDTTTTFAGALAAFYQRIAVGHVEAGLRTGEKYAPFPEEINRCLNSVIADLHFAPTTLARDNLLREGISPERIFVTGNTVIDALQTTVQPGYIFGNPALRELDFSARRVLLLETHRRENLGEPMRQSCEAIRRLLDDFPDTVLVFPMHKNPAVRRVAAARLEGHPRAVLLEPLDTLDFHNLMARSCLIFTDSGGIQEEAPSLGVPVIVLRAVTERPEAVDAGTAVLAGTDVDKIYETAARLLQDRAAYAQMARTANPYGDGRASERITQIIMDQAPYLLHAKRGSGNR
ncbi:MAG: UDP-N-acetylglucosamine 2-epimerase (non-hydrolyzing) [Bacillota bacterium]